MFQLYVALLYIRHDTSPEILLRILNKLVNIHIDMVLCDGSNQTTGIMDLHIGKQKFIESWGRLASGWGVPPAMAQLHALLLISPEPLTADEIRAELDISAGNASMTLRSLLDWGLIYREQRPNERKDIFFAEKDMWKVSRQIILNRKKRELEPMLQVLDELACVEENCEKSRHFCSVVRDMRKFSHKANQALDTLVKAESGWLASLFMR